MVTVLLDMKAALDAVLRQSFQGAQSPSPTLTLISCRTRRW